MERGHDDGPLFDRVTLTIALLPRFGPQIATANTTLTFGRPAILRLEVYNLSDEECRKLRPKRRSSIIPKENPR